MFARITRFEDSPEGISAAVDQFQTELAPAAKRLPGCAGTYLFVDRKTGRGMSLTLWRNEAAMEGGEEIAEKLRSFATRDQRKAGLTLWAVERYEVAVGPD
jgi:heme-degrading monooxygenase HmoA